jgi:transcriptional antiterminator NusG
MAEQAEWYVVQTLSGQEFKVRDTILRHRDLEGLQESILDVQVPTERVSEVRRGRKTTTNRKVFPGYILVQMVLVRDGKTDNGIWYFIRDTQGVIGFLGGEHPVPLSPDEVNEIMAQGKQGDEGPKPKVSFEMGETVIIRDGAFENFEGVIESVDPERGKLKLSVSIFGRSTPVEVEYWQVERG